MKRVLADLPARLKACRGVLVDSNVLLDVISSDPDDRWNNNDLHNLGTVTASDFEVVQMSEIYGGQVVTLSWSVTGAEYNIITPQAGRVRGNSIVLTPPAGTTTYTLEATNHYGRTKKSLTITVSGSPHP